MNIDQISSVELESQKLQFNAFLEEYRSLRDQILEYRKMQGQMDNIALVGLGVSVPLILTILERDPSALGSILLLSILFFAIAFIQLRYERSLVIRAIYVDSDLRPSVNSLLSGISKRDTSVFNFEHFISVRSWAPKFYLEWMATLSRAIISLAVGVGTIFTFLYLRLINLGSSLLPFEWWLILLVILFLVGDIVIGYFVARIRYRYLFSAHYEKNESS